MRVKSFRTALDASWVSKVGLSFLIEAVVFERLSLTFGDLGKVF